MLDSHEDPSGNLVVGGQIIGKRDGIKRFSDGSDRMSKTRNFEVLASFVKYCKEHPEERFWQALRNWSRFEFIIGRDLVNNGGIGVKAIEADTFYFEGKDR